MMNRRQFGLLLGSSARSLQPHASQRPSTLRPTQEWSSIGGGPGGATAAKYIAKESGDAIEVTLVEPTKQFTTCFHSNLYLGGFKPFEAITHTYDKAGVLLRRSAPILRKQTQQENIGWYSGITADIFG